MTVEEYDVAAATSTPPQHGTLEVNGRLFRLSWSGWTPGDRFIPKPWMPPGFICGCWVAIEMALPYSAYLAYTTGVTFRGPTVAGCEIGPPIDGWPMATSSISKSDKKNLRDHTLKALISSLEKETSEKGKEPRHD